MITVVRPHKQAIMAIILTTDSSFHFTLANEEVLFPTTLTFLRLNCEPENKNHLPNDAYLKSY